MAMRRSGGVFLAVLAVAVATVALRADRGPTAAVVHLQLGDLLFRDARYEAAVTAYRAAWASGAGAERVRAGNGLVRALLRTDEFREARVEADATVDLAPRDPETLALSGDALWAAGWFEEAEGRYHEAAALRPDYAPAIDGLARSAAARYRLDEALALATRATALPTRQPEHLHTLGYVNERLGRYPAAAGALSEYLAALSPRDRARRGAWTAKHARFLASFGERHPWGMTGDIASGTHVVPFRLVRNKIVVSARINGEAGEMVLDTGAELTAITRRTAQRLHVDPVVTTISAGVGQIGERALQLGRLDSLQVGTLRVENVPTLIKNPALTDLPSPETDGFSPLDWGLSVQVDYARRVLTIAREFPLASSGTVLPTETVLPLRLHRLATVRGSVGSANVVNFVVDTGGEVISISRSVFDLLNTEPPRRIPLKVYGVSGWDPDAFLMPGLDVSFERVSLPNLSVVVLNLDAASRLLGFDIGGIVGHKFLGKYRVTFDLPRSELRLAAI